MDILNKEAAHIRICGRFQGWLHSDSERKPRGLESALHHLEAGRKTCSCEAFREAQGPCTDNEGYGELLRIWDGTWRIGSLSLPPISFCPWCGGKLSSTESITQPTINEHDASSTTR